jgi:pimeloyl-ACP methyl ester carboxylesterase
MIALTVSFSCMTLLCLILFLGGYITYRMAFYNNVKKNPPDPYKFAEGDDPRKVLSRELIGNILDMDKRGEFESVYISSHDGLKLHARLYLHSEGAPFAICAHGYKSYYAIDFSGGCPDLISLGFNVLLIDQRACGESEGVTVSFGYNERRDILSWIDYIEGRFGKESRILLSGVSMGAATVLYAAALGLPPSAKCVFADCPYSSAREIIRKTIGDMHLPTFLYPLVRFGAKIYGGFDPNAVDIAAVAENIDLPTVIIHGEGDDFVPCSMSERIAAANARSIALYTFPDAHHAVSYLYDRERYRSVMSEYAKLFFEGSSEK